MTPGRVEATDISGLRHLPAFRADDDRGRFVKVHPRADEPTWDPGWAETYYSTSKRGVIRGMHLQLPPHDHHKLVHCMAGRAIDVILDLRSGSPTFGRHTTIELGAETPEVVVVPPGCAHGFQAVADNTVMLYLVSSVHAPTADTGIVWDSFGCRWPLPPSAVSTRDEGLPTLAEFTAAGHSGWRE